MKNKVVISFILIIFILFFTCNICFASVPFDDTYEVKFDYSDTNIIALEEQLKEDSRVLSGEYYYFVGYNTGDNCYNAYLVSKSAPFLDMPYFFNVSGWTKNGYIQSGIQLFADSSEGSIVRVSGKNGVWGNNCICIDVKYDDSNKVYTIPFASNYPGTLGFLTSNGIPVIGFTNPYIVNSAEALATGKFDYVLIDPGDFDIINNNLYLHICKRDDNIPDSVSSYYYTDIVYPLSFGGAYYEEYEDGFVYYFGVPKDKFIFNNNEHYIFYLSSSSSNLGGSYSSDVPISSADIFDTKVFTVGGLTEEDIEANRVNSIIESNNKTTEAIKENTETNKNIFEKIGDILSYINPFSENFFGKKLVDLILDGLKSLFVPSEDFFTNWFDDLNEWLGDRFGILYFPTEIVLDFLNRVGALSESSDYTLTVPEFKLDFFGTEVTFFKGYTYDFNELLVNDTFKNIHTIYLTVVDVILYLCLVILAHNAFTDVFGGNYIDEVVEDTTDYVQTQKINSRKIKPGFNTGGRR